MRKLILDDPETKSPDLTAEHVEQLRTLFPEAFTEGKLDFDVLKELLGNQIDEREEKYGLNWYGKRQARQLALTPSTGTLRPSPEDSVDWDNTKNLMIEGDNLEVLKLLQRSYSRQIKLIYVDPPYNKGKDFVYADNYQDSISRYFELTTQVTESGQKLTSNTESSGRFHTNWLNMLYPRLKLAWNLLRPDGAIFISIDENELHHLRLIANEVFGEETFVADISVVTNMKGRNDKKYVAACHEHVLIHAKPGFVSYGLPLSDEQRAAFDHEDERGLKYALRDLRKRGGPDKREDRPKMYFPIYWNADAKTCSLARRSADEIEIFPLRGDGSEGCWRWGKDKVKTHLLWLHPKKSDRTERWDVDHRVYLDPTVSVGGSAENDEDDDDENGEDEVIERTAKPKSIWLGGEFSSDSGKRALKEHLPGESFDFPKSVDFIRQIVQISAGTQDIVLDIFAGSGTTGQAVMAHNVFDHGSRTYILIQLPEPLSTDNKQQKAAALFCDEISKPRNLAELTKERLRRVGRKTRDDNPLFPCDVGFRVFKLDSTNIKEWDPNRDQLAESLEASADHLKYGRTEQDILFELLLKLGLELTVPIETRMVAGKAVQSVGAGTLIVCLDKSIDRKEVEPLALGIVDWHKELNPAGECTVVVRDSAFADDVAKTNLAAILQQYGLENVRSL